MEHANLSTVSYNKLFSAVTGSNSAAKVLGDITQSMNSFMYTVHYMSKKIVELSLWSKSPDYDANPESIERYKIFIATHVLNSLDRQIELSDIYAESHDASINCNRIVITKYL
mmetsp:Transcript_4872/g.6310  ORF Transcript_4872/g.6310 Transcript_4872/m.6310 type:complete len:113 (-) Transcript_4872:109-447(-)